jgi:hypothetical protein
MKTTILLLLLAICAAGMAQDTGVHIMLKDKRYLNVQKVVVKDSNSYVIMVGNEYLQLNASDIDFKSQAITDMPYTRLNTPGELLVSSAKNIKLGICLGLLAPLIATSVSYASPKLTPYALSLGGAISVFSLGMVIGGTNKIGKAGKIMSAKKL